MTSTKSSSPEPPAALFGYDVVNQIGEGAASKLYAVTDSSGHLFTLKHVVKKEDGDDRFLQQLKNEYDMSLKFRHPALRKVVEWKVPRRFFSNKFDEAALILEWVDGQPMDEKVPPDLPTLLSVFIQAGAALISLHKLRLVHCDFKPHNVLLCDGGKIKLIDFGQTCVAGTTKLRVQGTPDFITPEQVKCAPLEPKTDLYSFGASLYWALTGTRIPTYFTVDKSERDIVKHQQFPTPRELKPTVPERLSEVIMHCLRYNPAARPDDMAAVLHILEEFARPSNGTTTSEKA